MNEMTSVATNGNWVMMIVNSSAGISGNRRAQVCFGVSSSCSEHALGVVRWRLGLGGTHAGTSE